MRQSVRTLVQVGFAGAIVVFLPAASCTGGVRNNNDGVCPLGQTCSNGTPLGLHFIGLMIGDGFFDFQQVKTTAQGGTQTVQIEVGDDGGPLSPFTLPYTASVEGGGATIANKVGSTVVLRGTGSDPGYLRIDDPSGKLYDRVAIASRPLAKVEVWHTFSDQLAGVPQDGSALYAPGSVGYVALRSPDNGLVVDDSMQLTGDGISQTGWDQIKVGSLAAGLHDVSVTAAGQSFKLAIEVAPGPDRIETPVLPQSLTVGASTVMCAVAFRGDRHIHVAWSFSATNATVTTTTTECVGVVATKAGTVTLHINAGGLTTDRDLPAVAASARSSAVENATPSEAPIDQLRRRFAPHAAGELTFGDTAGERAAMQE